MERYAVVGAARDARRMGKAKSKSKSRPSDEATGERFLVEQMLRATERKYLAANDERTRLLDSLSLRNAEAEHESEVFERQRFLRDFRRMGLATKEDFKLKPELHTGRIARVAEDMRELRERITRLAWEISELKYQLAESRRYRR